MSYIIKYCFWPFNAEFVIFINIFVILSVFMFLLTLISFSRSKYLSAAFSMNALKIGTEYLYLITAIAKQYY